MSSVTIPYLGSKIVLYTKSAIRYEGTLYSIDTKESTVALAKVRSFGTEARPTDRPVGASNKIYEYVIFKGNEIQDIYVCQPPRPQPMLEGGLPNDPAIVQHSATGSSAGAAVAPEDVAISTKSLFPSPPHAGLFPTQQPGFNKTEPSNVMDILLGKSRSDRAASNQGRRDSAPQLDHQGQRRFSGQQNWNRDAPRFYRGRGRSNFQQSRGGPRGFTVGRGIGDRRSSTGSGFQPGRPAKPKETIKFETEFDFEQANEEFKDVLSKFEKVSLDDKEKAANGDDTKEEVEEGEIREDAGKAGEPDTFYDKTKSFFDKISCNAIDSFKEGGANKRPDWKAEKKVNIETFGASGNFNSGRGRRGGYQRGRGGSGGYGRGRGGYNKPSNGFNQGGYSGGYGYNNSFNNGFGRFSRENPPAFMSGRRQSTPGSFEQQFRWGSWGQQQQGRGAFRGRRGRQWANNTIF